jgi:hypothetical protein
VAISDAQFALWLEQDSARRRCLYEIDYRFQAESFVDPDTIYTPTTGTIYLADAPYIDSAAEVAYSDRVRGDPGFKREIDRKTLTGKTITLDVEVAWNAGVFVAGCGRVLCSGLRQGGPRRWASSLSVGSAFNVSP